MAKSCAVDTLFACAQRFRWAMLADDSVLMCSAAAAVATVATVDEEAEADLSVARGGWHMGHAGERPRREH